MNKVKLSLKLQIKIPSAPKQIIIPTLNLPDNRHTISEITSSLYLSGYCLAMDTSYLLKEKFTHIINCASGSSLINPINEEAKSEELINVPSLHYGSIYLRDDPSADITSLIYTAINFIESSKSENKKIGFHCIEGISRGPAVLAGYLMWKNNLTLQEAISGIKSKRKCIDINLGFMIQLSKWEKYLFGNKEQINIFRLHNDIVLLDEKELELIKYENNYENEEGGIIWKGKLIIMSLNKNTMIETRKNIGEINEFIHNIQKYDKYICVTKPVNGFKMSNLDIGRGNIKVDEVKSTKGIIEKVGAVLAM